MQTFSNQHLVPRRFKNHLKNMFYQLKRIRFHVSHTYRETILLMNWLVLGLDTDVLGGGILFLVLFSLISIRIDGIYLIIGLFIEWLLL